MLRAVSGNLHAGAWFKLDKQIWQRKKQWYTEDDFSIFTSSFSHITGHLIGCDKKSEIVRCFPGRLCDKIGLLCDRLCDFFRANLHCFTRFQRRKNTLVLFNRQFEYKGIIKHLVKTK